VIGMFAASTIVGRLVTKTGTYKRYMLMGATSLTAGLALMGLMDETTSLVELGAFMAMVGAGLGMLMQNLILVVQNTVRTADMGAGSALVAFSRSMGGAIGVSVLGAVLAAKTGGAVAATSPAAAHVFGAAIGELFLIAAPLGLVVLTALFLMRERPLGSKSGIELAGAVRPAAAPR
jgi:MFS family permease